ncbi:hypothetical protein DEO72_LG8g1149 [Vigna unguiculata]|uniref:Uncharacterized protein n=1 Tax=Vigna unguiculata TaxID=3917 RepID=A0A4D6MQ19_VIGUN|nr:hypothetical protein DEO72_LG8g1149 [Vigna unguiculata]
MRSPKRMKERIEFMNDNAGKEAAAAAARSLRLRWRLVSRRNNSKSTVQFFEILVVGYVPAPSSPFVVVSGVR